MVALKTLQQFLFPTRDTKHGRRPTGLGRDSGLESLEERVVPFAGPTITRTYVSPAAVALGGNTVSYSNTVQGATVRIASGFVAAEDRLLFTNQGSISGSYNTATGVLTLTGAASGTTYEAAIKTIQYQNLASNPSNADRGLFVQLGTATYDSGTGHYFEYIPYPATPLTWSNARNDASSRNNLGLTGYLATIGSAAEQSFVRALSSGTAGWLGGNDEASNTLWRWVTGPEGLQSGGAGQTFNSGGTPVGGLYNNWAAGNPVSSSTLNYVGMSTAGTWVALTTTGAVSTPTASILNGQFVEFGGIGTTPSFNDRWNYVVKVLDRTETPTLTTPGGVTVVNAATATVAGAAQAGSLVGVYADADNNGVADTPGTSVASQQLGTSATSYSISVPLTQNAANNFVVLATAYTGANASLAADVPTITEDSNGPSVAIGAPSATVTGSVPVTFTVTYSDPNFNAATLGTGDITLNKTGSATGTISVTGSGASRDVTVSGISGNGTLGISVAAGTASDQVGNLAPAAGPSAVFTVDNIPPVIASIASPSGNGTYTTGQSLAVSVTFSEPVTLVGGSLLVTLDSGAKVSVAPGSGTTLTGTYTVQAGDTSPDLTATSLALAVGATLRDAAANNAVLALPVSNLAQSAAIIINPLAPTTVSLVTVNMGDAQRSRVNSLQVDFAVPLDAAIFTNPGGVALTRTSGGPPVTLTAGSGLSIAPTTGNVTSITITFTGTTGVDFGSLGDGRWQLAVPYLSYTSPLNGLDLRRLFGDANNDLTVDITDLTAFGNAFNSSSPVFDYNNDGVVNITELAAFGNRFGVVI